MKNDNELVYRVWLNDVCDHSPKLLDKFAKLGFTPKELYDGAGDKRALKQILRLRYSDYKRKSLESAEEILKHCDDNNIRILTIDDEDYPYMLRNIYSPPSILYTKGDSLNLNDYIAVTIVGSRGGSDEIENFTRRLAYDLAAAGIIIVSGMALKLDSAAHTGALMAGQKTIAVLAGGVDVIYPKSNSYLYEKILENGMIVSERPPETVGKAGFYEERNRIMVGMSHGVVITEGAKNGGTSITARHGTESGRDMFAVPGRPDDELAYVPNAMLRDGAILTLSASDVLNEYENVYAEVLENGRALLKSEPVPYDEKQYESFDKKPHVKKSDKKQHSKDKPKDIKTENSKPDFSGYNENERLILEYLYEHKDGPSHIDEIIRATGLGVSVASNAVIMLQIKGAVKQSMGNLYTLVL